MITWGRWNNYSKETAERRFLEKTERAPNGCLLWTGSLNSNPKPGFVTYGMLGMGGKRWLAHRASYALFVGDPSGMLVCHSCDNGLCVEPTHLFLGTSADNAQDMERKGRGRHQRSEDHWAAKLTNEQVSEVRTRLAAGEKGAVLARQFGVSKHVISKIKHGRTYQQI